MTILAYHRVTKKNTEDIKSSLPTLFVTEASFIKQLEFIKKHFTIITFTDLAKYGKKDSLPPNALIITFDDGYEDNYTNAFPIMSSLNVRSVMFLSSSKIGKADGSSYWWDRVYYYFQDPKWYIKGAHPELDGKVQGFLQEFHDGTSKLFSRLDKENTRALDLFLNSVHSAYGIQQRVLEDNNRVLDWEQVRKMGSTVDFGSHTCNHYNLVALDDDSVAHEVTASLQEVKSKASCTLPVFSYPGGNYNEQVKKAVADAGYHFAVTTEVGVNDLADRYALKRISVWEGTSRGLNGKFSESLFAFKLLGN